MWSLCDRLVSLSILFSRFMHVVACNSGITHSFFITEKNYKCIVKTLLQVGFPIKKFRDGIRHAQDLLVSNICERKRAEAGLYREHFRPHCTSPTRVSQSKDHPIESFTGRKC